MAFKFRLRAGPDSTAGSGSDKIDQHNHSSGNNNNNNNNAISSKSDGNIKSTSASRQAAAGSAWPQWLKDGVRLSQLPAVYQGVLGQVQVQAPAGVVPPSLRRPADERDYMQRFTDTERVRQLLAASRLQTDQLAAIWAHCNKTYPGKLTNREVCLALALIAKFQQQQLSQPNLDNNITSNDKQYDDPFGALRLDSRAPIPILYPVVSGASNNSGTVASAGSAGASSAVSDLLLDLSAIGPGKKEDKDVKLAPAASVEASLNLIDGESPLDTRFQLESLARMWARYLAGVKLVFKRSFDVLNVENSRQSALDALGSERGKRFSKQLCLCYPLAHNIKLKIDLMKASMQPSSSSSSPDKRCTPLSSPRLLQQPPTSKQGISDKTSIWATVFNEGYFSQTDDLMTSINEYWAVLINLFHESGQTKFIEFIMDGLLTPENTDGYDVDHHQASPTKESSADKCFRPKTTTNGPDELEAALRLVAGRQERCAICHSRAYLTNCAHEVSLAGLVESGALGPQEAEELRSSNALMSRDGAYYYHARCANFWLNQVDRSALPFACRGPDELPADVLSPSSGLVCAQQAPATLMD